MIKKKNNYNKLELEIKDLTSQMQEEENQLVELNFEKKQLEEKLFTLMSELKIANDKCKEASKEYEVQREIAMKNCNAIQQHKYLLKKLTEEISTNEVNLAELSSEITKMNNGSLAAKEKFKDIDKRLPDEQKQMALKMDFINFKSEECNRSVNELQTRYDQLTKVVDPGKLNNFYKHIQEYKRLQKKLETIVKDKIKINEIIEELEVKKRLHLQYASNRVNTEFGKIFSSVLPGAQACLKQTNEEDITTGLEIRVAFNGLWKESLEELSGGQRSLVALSLVLAMLLFNPVPLYILDEVDAALDLSHTQNIGKMLKQHFKQSQFIVVSPKDGMFSNANILFRTKFVDGSSALDGRMLAGQMKRVSGGVGRNIADALGRFGHDVCFMSAVGDDSNGDTIIKSLGHINTDKIVVANNQSTSWCVVFQDQHGDCMACIGDMECHKRISVDMIKKNIDALYQSPLVVIDGNVCPETMEFVIRFCNEENIPVYFETTDIAVASKPFYSDMWKALSFMSPNLKELQEISKKLPAEERVNYAIKVSINGGDEFDTRDRIMNSSKDIVCKLISHIPVIMVTLGDKGLLLASRQSDDTVSLVHYPAQKIETPVSASGAGDCLCAGYISGVLQGKPQEECVAMGLKAATSALLSHRPVPIELNAMSINI